MRIVQNVFEPKASRILRVLLLNPGRTWTIRKLASEAGVAYGYVHAIVATLTRNRYVVRNEAYRLEVVDPIRILRRWAAYHQFDAVNTVSNYYTFEREVDNLVKGFRSKATDHALTGLAGAWLVAPQVRPISVDVYVRSQRQEKRLAQDLELKLIPKEGNVRLIIPYDDGVFYKPQVIDEVNVVSNVQLFVDLYNQPARGEEAAVSLLPLIEKDWSRALLGAKRNV
jgi:hypothetical protein